MATILYNKISIGSSALKNLCVGSTEVKYVKIGSNLAYDTQSSTTYDNPTVSLSYPTTATSAAGGTVSPTLTYSQAWRKVGYSGATYEQSKITSGASKIEYKITSGSGASIASDGKVTWTANTTTSTRTIKVTVTVTVNGKSTTSGEITVNQSSGGYTYGAWTVSASANTTTVAAAGGSATITASASRTYGWNGATSGAGTQTGTIKLSIPTTTGATLSGTASGSTLTWANNTTTSQRSVVVTATCQEDTSKTATVTIKQSAGTVTYTIDSYSVSLVALGTAKTQAITYDTSWNGVTTATNTALSGYTITESSDSSSAFSASGTSGTVTLSATNNTTTSSRTAKYTISKSGYTSGTITVTQAAGTVTYTINAASLSFTAAAATKTPSITYTTKWNGTTTASSTALSGYTLTEATDSSSAFSTNGTTVTAAANTTTSSRSATYTISKSGYTSGTLTCTQSADSLTGYKSLTATLSYPAVGPSKSSMTASPTLTVKATPVYASGKSASAITIPTSGYTVTYSESTASSYATVNTASGVVTWSANNGVTSNRTAGITASITCTSTYSSLTGSATATSTCTKDAIKSSSTSNGSWSGGTITANSTATLSAGADTRTITIAPWSRTNTTTHTWNSGHTSTSTATEYYTGSVAISINTSHESFFKLSATSFTASSSNYTVTLYKDSFGTTLVECDGIDVVFAPSDTEINENSYWFDCTHNTCSTTSTISLSASTTSIGAGGGTSTITRSGTTKTTYTSGSESTSSFTPTLSIDDNAAANGFTLSGTTVTAANRGTIEGAERSCTVTASYTGATSKTVTISQAENKIASVSGVLRYRINNAVVDGDFPAEGTSSNSTTAYINTTVTYSSGSTLYSGLRSNDTYTDTTNDVTYRWSTTSNTTHNLERTGNIIALLSCGVNVLSRSSYTVMSEAWSSYTTTPVTNYLKFYQEANKVESSTVTSQTVDTLTASATTIDKAGGSVTLTTTGTTVYKDTYTSGSTANRSVSTTPTLSIPSVSTGWTLSGTTLTAAENTGSSRSVVVTATLGSSTKTITITQNGAVVNGETLEYVRTAKLADVYGFDPDGLLYDLSIDASTYTWIGFIIVPQQYTNVLSQPFALPWYVLNGNPPSMAAPGVPHQVVADTAFFPYVNADALFTPTLDLNAAGGFAVSKQRYVDMSSIDVDGCIFYSMGESMYTLGEMAGIDASDFAVCDAAFGVMTPYEWMLFVKNYSKMKEFILREYSNGNPLLSYYEFCNFFENASTYFHTCFGYEGTANVGTIDAWYYNTYNGQAVNDDATKSATNIFLLPAFYPINDFGITWPNSGS